MLHETWQLHLHAGHDAAACAAALQPALAALPGLARQHLGVNLPGCWGSGALTLDLHWHDAAHAAQAQVLLAARPEVARVDRVPYRRVDGGCRAPGLSQGIWRTLLLRVRPGTPTATVTQLEQDLLRMPQYITGIRNWQLGRATEGDHWTHVWQQEFAQLDDLHGEYLTHPYHWAWVDRWFDPEHPDWIVEAIAHVFCPLSASLLSPPSISSPSLSQPVQEIA